MDQDKDGSQPIIKSLPSLLEFGQQVRQNRYATESEELFYTCPQCGHPMVTKKCKIVCYTCHYFIGCVE